MSKGSPAIFGLAALGFLVLSRRSSAGTPTTHGVLSEGDEEEHLGEAEPPEASFEDLLADWYWDEPRIGRLYQVEEGDTLYDVVRRALWGNPQPRTSAKEIQATIDLATRVDCGPWNQIVNGKTIEYLEDGHYAVENGLSKLGVPFKPMFVNNLDRLASGLPPSSNPGNHLPLIWIPMIDVDLFMTKGEVTTFGQDYPDDGRGHYNMIDPPPWIIDLGVEGRQVAAVYGCALPEGDYRKEITEG